MKDRNKGRGGRVAAYGLLVALAMVMSYVEVLVPFDLGVPGVKLGLANLVTMVALYMFGERPALTVSLLRIVLTGFTFGNLSSMMYSLAGGIVSFLAMAAAKRSGRFGKTGVSVTGGVFHNIGQLLAASFVVETFAVFWYFPVLLLAGALTGTLIGLAAGEVLRRLPAGGTEL